MNLPVLAIIGRILGEIGDTKLIMPCNANRIENNASGKDDKSNDRYASDEDGRWDARNNAERKITID